MTLSKLIHSPIAGMVLGGLALGLTLYYGGNQPLIKQAAMGLNGNTSPSAPAAVF